MAESPRPSRSLLDRIVSLEGLLGLVGICLLAAGIVTGTVVAIFWGGLAIVGLIALYFVRKKDWKAHWEEMERLQSERGGRPRRSDSDKQV